MPPRLAVLAIVVFWLTTTTWLIYREILPQWLAHHGQPPSLVVEIPHEVGSDYSSWQVFLDGELAGMGRSEVRRHADRSFHFYSELAFNKPRLLNLVSKITTSNRVTEDRRLLSMSIKVRVPNKSSSDKAKFGAESGPGRDEDSPVSLDSYVEFALEAKVENGMLKPSLRLGDDDAGAIDLEPVKMSENSGVFNPLQLGNKMNGLYDGQTWRIPLLDPLAAALPFKNFITPELLALVKVEDLMWAGNEVPCFRIEFRKRPEDDPMAKIWVRQRDGVVLQQHLKDTSLNLDLKLVRGG